MASEEPGVGTRTVRGMFWAYGSYVGGRLLVLVSVGILARLLTPSEFGLVAIALVVTTMLDMVSDLGVSQALIVLEDDDAYDKADTAWTFGIIIGAALTVLTAALGPVAAAFFDEPTLNLMLPLLGFNFILRAVGATHFALAQKQIDFRTRTIAEGADVIVRGVIGIGLALLGAGAYSLVGGYLAGTAAMTGALLVLVRWRPRLRLRRQDLNRLLRFGGGVTLLGIISAIITNADYVAIGRVLGDTELGFYTLAWRLPELIIINLSVVAGLVLFPAFAGMDRPTLRDAYLTSLRYVLVLCMPMAVGLLLLTEPIVLLAFGEQWRDSVEVMQILTLFAFFVTVPIPAGIAFKAVERVDVLVKLVTLHAVLAVSAIVIFVDQGIAAVATCQASVAALMLIINLTLTSRLLETGWRRIWIAARPALTGGATLAVNVAALNALLANIYVSLVVSIAVGAVVYVATLWLVDPDLVHKLWRTALDRRDSEPPEADEELLDLAHDQRAIDLTVVSRPGRGAPPDTPDPET